MLERLVLTRTSLLAMAFTALCATCARAQDVDESALRYYAAQGQVKRVEAEARRLSALNPDWTMPEDVWSARAPVGDEGPFWTLLAAGDMDGLKRALAQRQIGEPGWAPSDDLLRKINKKELRDQIMSKAGQSQWYAVAEMATDQLKGRYGDDVELAWTVAEAFARTDRRDEAKSIFVGILKRSDDQAERRITVLKALALLPMADVEQLLDMGRNAPTGGSEFAMLATDLARGRIAALLRNERQAPIDAGELAAFETFAESSQEPGPAELVAWLALKENRLEAALKWFQLAHARSHDASSAHGLAQTLWRLGKIREAEEVAFASRDSALPNAILFVDMFEAQLTRPSTQPVEPERLMRFAKVTIETRSGEGAQALGWYAFKSCQFATALDWFRHASAWLPRETTILGLALSLQRLKRQREFMELVNRYDGLFPSVVGVIFKDGREDVAGPCDGPATPQRPRLQDAAGDKGLRSSVQVPQPDKVSDQRAAASQMAKIKDFPMAVAAENPLRFPESGEPKTKPFAGRPRDPDQRPLVARRVAGVTAMPYETGGLKLAPGWTGASDPSETPLADSPPAQGTIASQMGLNAPTSAPPNGRMSNTVSASGAQAVSLRLRR